jgi:hypothetical protein
VADTTSPWKTLMAWHEACVNGGMIIENERKCMMTQWEMSIYE